MTDPAATPHREGAAAVRGLVVASLVAGAAILAGLSLWTLRQGEEAMVDGGFYRDALSGRVYRFASGWADFGGPNGQPRYVQEGAVYSVPSRRLASDLGFDLSTVKTVGADVIEHAHKGPAYRTRGTFLPAGVECATPSSFNSDSQVGIALTEARKVLAAGAAAAPSLIDGKEREAYYGAIACLRRLSPRPIVLRVQLPIDIAREGAADRWFGELEAFTQLVWELGSRAAPVVTFRGPIANSTECPVTIEVSSIDGVMGNCEVPSVKLYGTLFEEARALLDARIPGVVYGAWNEPNHPAFSLISGALAGTPDKRQWAVRRAGEYWAAANAKAPGRVLAGEFSAESDVSDAALLKLRNDFMSGAGPVPGGRWALHPYADMAHIPDAAHPGIDGGASITDRFFGSDRLTWLTEVGPALHGRSTINGSASAQYDAGSRLRARLSSPSHATRLALYGLRSGGTFDASIGDMAGRARPFVCGLAAIAIRNCAGSPDRYGAADVSSYR